MLRPTRHHRPTTHAAAAAVLATALAGGCDRPPPGDAAAPAPPAPTRAWLVDITEASGLDFVHDSGARGSFYFPEISGSGCTLLDYDGDGDLDVYALQSFPLAAIDGTDRWTPPGDDDAGRNRLYRNDLAPGPDGRLVPRFVDVTDEAGIGHRGYATGCAAGDVDNDGDLDLYVTNFGPNVLYRNEGDGTFTDVSDAVPAAPRWSTSAAFLDYDADGLLDLFVASYVNFSVRENKICHPPTGRRDYCGPASFDPVPDRLFRNAGDGTFVDVTREAGIARAFGSGLGVVCADFDGDGRQDVYVANDGNANQLWMNAGDGTFAERSLLAGAAYNAEGMAEAGMGVSAADFDDDGDEDVFISHLAGETNTLLVNDGTGVFEDATDRMRLGAVSRPYTGFGVEWLDLEHDGDLDLLVANGAVSIIAGRPAGEDPYAFANQLLLCTGPPDYAYVDATAEAGPALALVETTRGAAFGDVDGDGDVDVLLSNRDGPLRLLRNDVADGASHLALELVGTRSPRDAVGAVARLPRPDGRVLARRVHLDGSYCSVNDPRLVFGLGEDDGPQTVLVHWPSGVLERFEGLAANRRHVLREGSGTAP